MTTTGDDLTLPSSPPSVALTSLRLLYLGGATPESDDALIDRLVECGAPIDVAVSATATEALGRLRTSGHFHALLTSPTLPQNEALSLIASIRRDRLPVAIVVIVAEEHQAFFASAIAAGADDALLLRGDTATQWAETISRIRRSPHVHPTDARRRLRVLYAGRDAVVWELIEQMPFVLAERGACSPDGVCPVRQPGAADSALRCDVVIVDEHPGDAHPLQVVKSIKGQASELPVVVLTSPTGMDVATAALDLGADDTVTKSGIYRRRLTATLRRLHQRIDMDSQSGQLREREARLRYIVEHMPQGLAVISGDGTVLAMNVAGLSLFGAERPRDLVGRDLSSLVVPERREEVRALIERVSEGARGDVEFDIDGQDGIRRSVTLRGVQLARDSRSRRGMIATLGSRSGPTLPVVDTSTEEAESALAFELTVLRTAQARAESEISALQNSVAYQREQWDAERREWAETRAELEARLKGASFTGDLSRERQTRRLAEVGLLAAAMMPDVEALLGAGNEPSRTEAERRVRQLAAFVRKQSQSAGTSDLADLIRQTEPTVRGLVGAHIDLEIVAPDNGARVDADLDDLHHLLTALVVLMRDRLPSGGTVRVEIASDAHSCELAVSAKGYGVTPVPGLDVIEPLAERCGATLDATVAEAYSTTVRARWQSEPGRRD